MGRQCERGRCGEQDHPCRALVGRQHEHERCGEQDPPCRALVGRQHECERCGEQDHPCAEHHWFLLVWSSSIDSAPYNIASILCGEQNTGIEVIYMSLICQFLIISIKSVLCMRHNFIPPILFPTLVEFRLVFSLKTKKYFSTMKYWKYLQNVYPKIVIFLIYCKLCDFGRVLWNFWPSRYIFCTKFFKLIIFPIYD